MRQPRDKNVPTEATEPAEPTLPTESTDPIDPMESSESRDPMHSTESRDHSDQREPRPSICMGAASSLLVICDLTGVVSAHVLSNECEGLVTRLRRNTSVSQPGPRRDEDEPTPQ
jgi:hypothetical protein